MKIKIDHDFQNDIESYELHKVSDKHFILTVHTKEKYYDDYSNISGMNRDKQCFVGVTIGNDYSEDGFSQFEIQVVDKGIGDFCIVSCIPLKHEYQCHIMHYDIAFVNSKLEKLI